MSDAGDVDCNEAVERLYHFLDGELTDDRRKEIERHLDECSPCVQAYGFETDLRQVIIDRCRDHVPDTLRERVFAAIEEEHRRQSGERGGRAGTEQ